MAGNDGTVPSPEDLNDALAPFLAEGDCDPNLTLRDVVARDPMLLRLLASYVELPGVIEEAQIRSFHAASEGDSDDQQRARAIAWGAVHLLAATGEAIRYCLNRMSER